MDPLLHPDQVAQRYEISPGTLANWRRENKGPRWVKLGDGKRPRVMYRMSDLLAWENERVSFKE